MLTQIDFFKGCTQRQVDDIAKLVVERDLESGEILCRQGERGADAFVIVDGQVAVLLDDRQIAVVGTGEVVGELSIERGGLRTATLKATTPLHVLVVDPREIESVLAADPKSAQSLGPRNPGDEVYPERRPS